MSGKVYCLGCKYKQNTRLPHPRCLSKNVSLFVECPVEKIKREMVFCEIHNIKFDCQYYKEEPVKELKGKRRFFNFF